LRSLIGRLVAFSCRWAGSVVALTLVSSLAAAVYVAGHFSVHTEMAALVPADVPWRVHERALEDAFIQQGDSITAVIDGRTPELAEAAAARLTAALAPRTDLFRAVERPGAGAFVQREGILFLPEAEVRAICDALIRAQPLLALGATDGSLRGILTGLSTGSEAVAAGQTSPDQIARSLTAIADAADSVERGDPSFFSWRPLITGQEFHPGDSRQFVELYPKLDYTQTRRGDDGISAVREAAKRLSLDDAHGVRLRLTGDVPMEADELGTLREATGFIALATFALVLAILYRAARSPKIVGVIICTVLVGLALTAAFGLAVYGRYNLISVAFLPLFVGLGIDFAIQFGVRYAAEALTEADIPRALTKAGEGAGQGLTLAAAAVGLSFLSFLPTPYRGVSELGFTAGIGMGIAFLLAITFLPAFLTLIGARSASAEVGFPALRDADAPLQAHRRKILSGTAVVALIALVLSPALKFDFDPLSLRNRKSESVALFLELAGDPETGVDTLDILAPDLAAARSIAARLLKSPEVREVVSIDSLLPADQGAKLALVKDAALLLDTTVNPFDVAPPPNDAELVASLAATVHALRALADAPNGAPVRTEALRLAGLLQAAQQGSPALRARLQATLVAGLPTALDEVRALLTAEPVTLDTLPADLKAGWIAHDGRSRLQVVPRAAHEDRLGVAAFVRATHAVAPEAVGRPVTISQTRRLIQEAFGEAAVLALVAITALLAVTLRSARAILLTLAPVLLTVLLSAATCVVLGQSINLENLIALPLLLGIGVSFNIYFVVAWLNGERTLLRSSLTRAILYSALATGTGFGTLSLSHHPGTASMGVLLMISLFWTVVVTLGVQPALLGVATDDR
jgi:hopanoid biosynthesis associated RND transporter like protein HpnN